MTIDPTELSVIVNESDSVTALIYPAPKKQRLGITLVLGHGAGANQLHPFMRLFASGLAERGLDVMTFNFIYMEKRRGGPDPKAKLEACYRAVIEAAAMHKALRGNRLAIGGKSMGGRIASQVAATGRELTPPGDKSTPKKSNSKSSLMKVATVETPSDEPAIRDLAGLVFLGYPLHPPGKPDQLRDAHLPQIHVPMLFVQGARDAFGTKEELGAVIDRFKLDAQLYVVEGGDHSLKVPKTLGVPQEQVYEQAMNEISRWLESL